MTALAATLFWLSALVPVSAPSAQYIEVALAVVHNFPVEARQAMVCNAWYESTFNPKAEGKAGERGVLQIGRVHFGRFDPERLWEVDYNIRAARQLYDESGLWPWLAQKGRCW